MSQLLTQTQEQILELTAIGLSAKEIADIQGSSTGTINTHLKNIKERLHLQKASELTAYHWCRIFGESFEEKRKQILSACMLVFFLITLAPDYENNDIRPVRARVVRITRIRRL